MPISIPIFVGVAAVLFVAGIFFIIKGISSENYDAVPISSPAEIEELNSAFAPPEKTEPSVKKTIAQQSEIVPEKQANQLMKENQRLTEQIRQQREKFERLEQNMMTLKKEYAQAQGADSALLNKLKAKSVLLEKQHEEGQSQMAEMEATVSQMNAEKGDLSEKLKRREGQAAELSEKLTALQSASDEKIRTAQAAIDQLRAQKMEDEKKGSKITDARFNEVVATIEDLKRENKNLQQSNWDLRDNFKKTEDLNAYLLEKEKTMQYELTKNRAQALGLEKICEDFKVRIESKVASTAT